MPRKKMVYHYKNRAHVSRCNYSPRATSNQDVASFQVVWHDDFCSPLAIWDHSLRYSLFNPDLNAQAESGAQEIGAEVAMEVVYLFSG